MEYTGSNQIELNSRLIQFIEINEFIKQEKKDICKEITKTAIECFKIKNEWIDVCLKDEILYHSIILTTNKELSATQLVRFGYKTAFTLLSIESHTKVINNNTEIFTKYIFISKHIPNKYANKNIKWKIQIKI